MKTGAQILLECLKAEGVDTIFGYPGARTLLVHDALMLDEEIKHILVRHEQGAAHAADGYSRTTGKVGVCLTTRAPALPTWSPVLPPPSWTRCRWSP